MKLKLVYVHKLDNMKILSSFVPVLKVKCQLLLSDKKPDFFETNGPQKASLKTWLQSQTPDIHDKWGRIHTVTFGLEQTRSFSALSGRFKKFKLMLIKQSSPLKDVNLCSLANGAAHEKSKSQPAGVKCHRFGPKGWKMWNKLSWCDLFSHCTFRSEQILMHFQMPLTWGRSFSPVKLQIRR